MDQNNRAGAKIVSTAPPLPVTSRRAALDRSLRLLLLSAVVALAACSTLPRYAAPKGKLSDAPVTEFTDEIPYRTLRRDDFRAEQPPEEFDDRMAAVSCVNIRPVVGELDMQVEPVARNGGGLDFDVTLHNLRYSAQLDRNCSWWNPRSGSDEDYILEHEQIHFALFELAARRWSELPPLRMRIKSATSEAMQQDMRNRFESYFQELLDSLVAENHAFDEDTSMGHNPRKQRQWLDKVRAGLAATAGD